MTTFNTEVEFRTLCKAVKVRVLSYNGKYAQCDWQCTSCKTRYTYTSAAKVLRRQFPCMCLEKQEYQAKLPKDVELIDYLGATKPCTWKCTRCSNISKGTPSSLAHNKVNCRCDGFAGSMTKAEFLLRLKYSKLPYKLVSWTNPRVKRALRLAEFECKLGHKFEAKPNVLLNGKHVCPTCKSTAVITAYKKRLAEEFPHIKLLGEYLGVHRKTLHGCTCGEQWLTKPMTCKNHTRKRGCPVCDYRSGGPKLKSVEFGERTVSVQGYEDAALKYLEQHTNINTAKLATSKAEGIPNIHYRFANKVRLYYPDFYYPPKKRLIEVKSVFTLLSVDYLKTVAKAKACLKLGYEFELILMHKTKKNKSSRRLLIPSDWYMRSRAKLLKDLSLRYPNLMDRLQSLPKSNPFSN